MNGSADDLFARFGLGEGDRAAWRSTGRGDEQLVDWLVDRVARRPSGARARAVYGAEDVHDFARRAILEALDLHAGDRLLDIGCGGGLLLRDAARAGAQVTGLDHSEEMVALARERAPQARILAGDADRLPFAAAAFTAVSMSVVFQFLADPPAVLRECRRVLVTGGALAVYATGPELRGTPAAPEPLASQVHFHSDDALAQLAADAGLREAAVANDGGGQLLAARR